LLDDVFVWIEGNSQHLLIAVGVREGDLHLSLEPNSFFLQLLKHIADNGLQTLRTRSMSRRQTKAGFPKKARPFQMV
jgi:hypothetical protein